MNINYNQETASSSPQETSEYFEIKSKRNKLQDSPSSENRMACVPDVTRVPVPTSLVSAVSSMAHNHAATTTGTTIAGNYTSCGSAVHIHDRSTTLSHSASLKIMAVNSVAFSRPVTTMKSSGTSDGCSSQSHSSGSSSSNRSSRPMSAAKIGSKKRGRSEDSVEKPSLGVNRRRQETASSDSSTLSEDSHHDKVNDLPYVVSNARAKNDFEYSDIGEGKEEGPLTQEQIDDVIDNTLPNNFSFSLPVVLSPSRNQASESPDCDDMSKQKKQPKASPPISVVFTKTESCHDANVADMELDSVDEPTTNSVTLGHDASAKTPTSGRWTREEHEAFLKGLAIYGREWKKVAKSIPTRTSAQIRSHAQKYFAKLSKDEQTRLSTAVVKGGGESVASSVNVGEEPKDFSSSFQYPPSVLDRMEKILRDPIGAEIEVAQTLNRLRERYNELHAKLQQQEIKESMKKNTTLSSDESTSGPQRKKANHSSNSDLFSPIYTTCANLETSANFTFLEPSMKTTEGTDKRMWGKEPSTLPTAAPLPSPAPTASRQARPCLRISNESLALHSQELIALSVLGGELYRSASHPDLSKAGSSEHASLPQDDCAQVGSSRQQGRTQFSYPALDPASWGDAQTSPKSSDTHSS